MRKVKFYMGIIKDTLIDFFNELPLIHGASLAYYAILALVPLIYLTISIFGEFVGNDTMQEIVGNLLRDQVGVGDISGIMEFLSTVDLGASNPSLRILGIIMVLFSCTAILTSLRKSINRFYGIERAQLSAKRIIIRTVLFRLLSMVFIVLVTVVVITLYFAETVILSIGDDHLSKYHWLSWLVNSVARHGVPILTNWIIFSFIFKYVHDGVLRWGIALRGALATAILLYLGQLLIKFYLSNYFFASEGGVAGTFLIVLVWVYYSSFILLLGVKFTAEYAKRIGEPIQFR